MGSPIYDVCVIGGGPAGLTAALYLARFHLGVCLVDGGESRTTLIARTHNQPFWPEGIEGPKMLDVMRSHIARYPIEIEHCTAEELQALMSGFSIRTQSSTVFAQAVLVATGIEDHRPSMTLEDHNEALRTGLLRYCPICDGYEVTDKAVAVVGVGDQLFGEAKFLRSYTSSVTAFSETNSVGLTIEQREALSAMGVQMVDVPARAYRIREAGIEILFGSTWHTFETMYAALGSTVRSGLLNGLGAEMTSEGCLVVDAHQKTSVLGLYAAGDVVAGVDQIAHAMGQAAVAATAIRNYLNAAKALVRRTPDTISESMEPDVSQAVDNPEEANHD